MKRLFLVLMVVLIVILSGCPTPFGIIYADRITHWNGETETIEDWFSGDDSDDEGTATVNITIDWGDE